MKNNTILDFLFFLLLLFCVGFLVHLRVFPIIYAPALLLHLASPSIHPKSPSPSPSPSYRQVVTDVPSKTAPSLRPLSALDRCRLLSSGLLSAEPVGFTILSASIFLGLLAVFYHLYGWPFLHETYLYHLGRQDHRHNFSVYFYQLYLNSRSQVATAATGAGSATPMKWIVFLPQWVLLLLAAFKLHRNLPFCFLLQTYLFVTFNKVMTAQYHVWYIVLLPLILPSTKIHFKWKGVLMVCLWIITEIHWLHWGYHLEFLGQNVFFQLWAASLLFFACNVWILSEFLGSEHHCRLEREAVKKLD